MFDCTFTYFWPNANITYCVRISLFQNTVFVCLGDQASLFTGVNYNGYGPPDGFNFDSKVNDEPIMVQ